MLDPAATAARAALVATALAVGTHAISGQREEDRCAEAGATVVREAQGVTSASASAEAVATLSNAACRDTGPLLVAAGALADTGRERTAARLARRAVDAEPENAVGWYVLAQALRRLDPDAARRAWDRAAELNPVALRSR